jgi:hypothetical protein
MTLDLDRMRRAGQGENHVSRHVGNNDPLLSSSIMRR